MTSGPSLGTIGKAKVDIEASFDKFRKSKQQGEKEAADMGGRMGRAFKTAAKGFAIAGAAAVAAGGAFSAMVVKALNAAEAIADAATRAGTAAETLQALRFAANQNGASFENMDRALLNLQRNLSLFAQKGVGPAADALEQLDLDVFDANGNLRDSGDIFIDLVTELEKMEDQALKAGIAAQLLGARAGPMLLPLINQGEAGLAELMKTARELGVVIDEDVVQNAGKASAQLRGLTQVVGQQMTGAFASAAPQVIALADAFTKSLPDIVKFIGSVSAALGLIETPVDQQLAEKVSELQAVQNRIARLASAAPGRPIPAPLQQREASLSSEVASLNDKLDALRAKGEAAAAAVEAALAGGDTPPGGGDDADAFGETLKKLREMTDAQNNLRAELDMTEQEAASFRAELEAFAIIGEVATKVTDEQYAALVDEANAYIEATERVDAYRTSKDQLVETERELDAAFDATQRKIDATAASIFNAVDGADSLEDALKRVAMALAEMALKGDLIVAGGLGGQAGQDMLSSVFGSILTAVTGGSINAPDTAPLPVPRPMTFSRGGVFTSPQLFPMARGVGLMAEAGPEAAMPLTRGPDGRLGVEAYGAGGGVVVNNFTPARIEAQQTDEGIIIDVVSGAIRTEGSRVSRAMQDRGNLRGNLR